MGMTRRAWLAGAVGALALLAYWWLPRLPVPPAHAQGVGIYMRTDCTALTGAVQGQTVCFDSTFNKWKAYNGTTWIDLIVATTTTGQIITDGGTCAAPAVTTVGQLSTGLVWPASGNVSICVGGQEAFRVDQSRVLRTNGGSQLDATPGHIEAHIATASAPGGMVIVNSQAASAGVGSTWSTYASGEQQGSITYTWLDGTTQNAQIQLGLRTNATTNAILSCVRDGTVEGTAFCRIGTGTAANTLELRTSSGPVLRLARTNVTGTLDLINDGSGLYITNEGAALPIIMRINGTEAMRIGTNAGFTIGSAPPTAMGAGTINYASAAFANGRAVIVASTSSANVTNVLGLSASSSRTNNLRGTCQFAGALTCTVAFQNNEVDAHYFAVSGCVVDITAKAKTGFTMTATTTSSSACDWLVLR